MAFIAVIQRGQYVIPILVGGDGPNAECMQTWDTHREATEQAGQVLLAQAFPVRVIDLDDADVS